MIDGLTSETPPALAFSLVVYSNWPRVRVFINDNYYVAQRGFVGPVKRTETLVNSFLNGIAVTRQPQKNSIRGMRPILQAKISIKGVCCVDQLPETCVSV